MVQQQFKLILLIAATVVLSSTAEAAEHQGSHLGMFEEAGEHGGRPYYVQKDTEGSVDTFLYNEGGNWMVSTTLGGTSSNLVNYQDTPLPPTDQWRYWDTEEFKEGDTSLILEFTALSPCQLPVTVVWEGDVVADLDVVGEYRYIFLFNVRERAGYHTMFTIIIQRYVR